MPIADMPETAARAFVERAQRLREEKAAIEADLKELYAEVKQAHGAMARATVKGAVDALMRPENKQAERERIADEVQALVDLIRDGKPVPQATENKRETKPLNERARTRSCANADSTPHDPDTGEVTETPSAASSGGERGASSSTSRDEAPPQTRVKITANSGNAPQSLYPDRPPPDLPAFIARRPQNAA